MATIVSSKTEQIFLLSALHRFLITLQGEFDCKVTEPLFVVSAMPRRNSHVKRSRTLTVLFWDINQGFWSHLG